MNVTNNYYKNSINLDVSMEPLDGFCKILKLKRKRFLK